MRQSAPIFAHQSWCSARSRVLDAFSVGSASVGICGGPGLGKTLLINDLVATLRHAGRPVSVHPRGAGLTALTRQEIVAIDDADRMPTGNLDVLRGFPHSSCLLAGRPGQLDRLYEIGPQLTLVTLLPLAFDEVGPFVAAELDSSGYPTGFVADEALEGLLRHSGGVPRSLSTLARAAALLAAADHADRIALAHVDRVAAMRSAPSQPSEARTGPAKPTRARPTPAMPPATLARRGSRKRLVMIGAGLAAAGGLPLVGLAMLTQDEVPRAAGQDRRAVLAVHEPASQARYILPAISAPPETPLPDEAPAGAPQAEAVAAVSEASAAVSVAKAVAAALPGAVPAHVVVVFTRGDDGAKAAAETLTARLRAEGFAIAEPTPVGRQHPLAAVTYFYSEDRDAAVSVAQRLDPVPGPVLTAATPSQPLPRPGTVQIAPTPDLATR
jgi:hypothetical protein